MYVAANGPCIRVGVQCDSTKRVRRMVNELARGDAKEEEGGDVETDARYYYIASKTCSSKQNKTKV